MTESHIYRTRPRKSSSSIILIMSEVPPDECEIPELSLLGRSYFPEQSTEEFWQILFYAAEQDFETIEFECLDDAPVPDGFIKLHERQLSFWKALSWFDVVPGATVGVLVHPKQKVFIPLVRGDVVDTDLWLSPVMNKFTPEGAAKACLAAFDRFCEDSGGVVPAAAEFINHQPALITRAKVKAVFARYWDGDSADLDRFFADSYSEEP